MQGCSSWRISAGSFGTSRKTGYKIFGRYQECGIQGLTDRSRRPCRDANQLAFQVEHFILNVKREHVSWGARKVGERLLLPILRNSHPGNYWKPSGRTGETSVYYDGWGFRESWCRE